PFVDCFWGGYRTTLIASCNLQRKCIGIDINLEYKNLALQRLNSKGYKEHKDFSYLIGDALSVLKNIDNIDYIVTSPPYHNILRNDAKGIRADKKS
ncbi:hypothetical protein, partial [Rickettsia sp. TH2014]|uniref:hypothetical protein n=1 Tax=Rickettsia sp. TH2014 TaxID=1967503 RepID=UPI001C4683EA